MAEKPEDFNLPNSVVTKLIKDALPEGVEVTKDAKAALSKATSIFILYATSCTTSAAANGSTRRPLSGQDVINAIHAIGYSQFVPELNKCYEDHKKEKAKKDKMRAKVRAEKAAAIGQPSRPGATPGVGGGGGGGQLPGNESRLSFNSSFDDEVASQSLESQIIYETIEDSYED